MPTPAGCHLSHLQGSKSLWGRGPERCSGAWDCLCGVISEILSLKFNNVCYMSSVGYKWLSNTMEALEKR